MDSAPLESDMLNRKVKEISNKWQQDHEAKLREKLNVCKKLWQQTTGTIIDDDSARMLLEASEISDRIAAQEKLQEELAESDDDWEM